MPFQLNITFAGMCLLVHDRKGDKLQVLLPAIGTGPGGHHQSASEHIARLIYDPAHDTRDGTPGRDVPVRREDDVPLENTAIDLSGLGTRSAFEPAMPGDVVDLAQATAKPVSRALFRGDTGGRVLTRVTLGHGRVAETHGGGIFRLGRNAPQRMATGVVWTIDEVQGDSLVLELSPISGGSGSRRHELFPTRDGKLNLYVFHSTADDLPVTLPPRYQSRPESPGRPDTRHFAAYYDLIEDLDVTPPVPEYEGETGRKAGSAEGILGLKITCITATATA